MTFSGDEIAELEARMRPGALSRAGFLGPSENLRAVMAADALAMKQAGQTFEAVAAALEVLIGAAAASPGHEVTVGGRYQIRVQQYLGFQICPWSPDPNHAQCSMGEAKGLLYSSLDWRLENLRTGEAMEGPGLIVHLMYDHHFCEGRGSPNRVDPIVLARVLELT
jgi:hypothetical protein